MPAVVGVACVLQGALGSTPLCLPRGGGPSAGGVELRSCCLPIDAASALRPGYALEGEGGRRRGGVQARCCQGSAAAHATDLTLTFAQRGAAVSTTRLRTHGLESGACRRPETERQGLPMRPSHDSVWRSESSLHTMGPPVLLNSIIGTPGGRYMRLVTPLRAPFAAPIAPSHRGGLVQHFPPRQQYTASRLGTWRGPAGSRATVANAKGNLAPLLSRVGPSSMPVVVGRHEYVIKIRCSSPPH